MEFYSTAAQVIPILALVVAVEIRVFWKVLPPLREESVVARLVFRLALAAVFVATVAGPEAIALRVLETGNQHVAFGFEHPARMIWSLLLCLCVISALGLLATVVEETSRDQA